MTNTIVPEELRQRITATVRDILRPSGDLEAMARDLDLVGSTGIGSSAWSRNNFIDGRQCAALLDAIAPAFEYNGDLVLLTGDEHSPPYMTRWWLTRDQAAQGGGQHGLYAHVFENDDPVGLHSHPWTSAAVVLAGRMHDNGPKGAVCSLVAGDAILRPAGHRHRITLDEPSRQLSRRWRELTANPAKVKAVTLIATGRRRNEGWGFVKDDGSIQPVASYDGPQGEPVTRRPGPDGQIVLVQKKTTP